MNNDVRRIAKREALVPSTTLAARVGVSRQCIIVSIETEGTIHASASLWPTTSPSCLKEPSSKFSPTTSDLSGSARKATGSTARTGPKKTHVILGDSK